VRATAEAPLCDAYLGDNDGTCPQLTCVRSKGHEPPCDNVRGDEPVTATNIVQCAFCNCEFDVLALAAHVRETHVVQSNRCLPDFRPRSLDDVRAPASASPDDLLEEAFWRFDALHKAYCRDVSKLPGPMSERDAFKSAVRWLFDSRVSASAKGTTCKLTPAAPIAFDPDEYELAPPICNGCDGSGCSTCSGSGVPPVTSNASPCGPHLTPKGSCTACGAYWPPESRTGSDSRDLRGLCDNLEERAEKAEAAVIVHAFDDKGRKDAVRDLAARVKATEDELRERRSASVSRDPFACCGGNDEKPQHHCSDCPDHPWEGEPSASCMTAPTACPHRVPASSAEASTSTSEMTAEEISCARGRGLLTVDADGLGTVSTAWLREWRARKGVSVSASAQHDFRSDLADVLDEVPLPELKGVASPSFDTRAEALAWTAGYLSAVRRSASACPHCGRVGL